MNPPEELQNLVIQRQSLGGHEATRDERWIETIESIRAYAREWGVNITDAVIALCRQARGLD